MDSTETLLRQCISRFATLYIVIDSLDEFEKAERNVLLRSLSSIISLPDTKARLFLVGRRSVLTDIRKWFPAFHENSTDSHEVQVDIAAYAQENIVLRQADEHEPLILQNPDLAQEIIRSLTDGANGMCVIPFKRQNTFADFGRFLWVDYQIAEVCECTCDDEIREVLVTLPKSLGETFDRAMRRIAKRGSVKTAINIFQWVAATKRTSTLDELREALSYEPGKPYSIPGKRPNGLERITVWCENLVQLNEELEIVQFTHSSERSPAFPGTIIRFESPDFSHQLGRS